MGEYDEDARPSYDERLRELEREKRNILEQLRDTVAQRDQLRASLLDYWGEFGACKADNGKFRARAYDLVEAELRASNVLTAWFFKCAQDGVAPELRVCLDRGIGDEYTYGTTLLAAGGALCDANAKPASEAP